MYIEELSIEGYKNFGTQTNIRFHKGLNVLVGENGTGKSSIIDATRLLLSEDEYGRYGIRDIDFFQPFEEIEDALSDALGITVLLDVTIQSAGET